MIIVNGALQVGRRALVKLNCFTALKLNLPKGETKCYVLGIFQQTTDCEHYPVALCELDDGRVFYADPEDITFIDRGDFNDIYCY